MYMDIVASIPYTYVHIVIGSIVQNADESGARVEPNLGLCLAAVEAYLGLDSIHYVRGFLYYLV